MTHAVELPALDGRGPLGFLASLGLLNALSGTAAKPPSLSFSQTSAAAIIHSHLVSLDQVAAELEGITATAERDVAIAGVDPRFPLRPRKHADPMRRPREEYRELAAEIGRTDPVAAGRWLPHLITDLAIDQRGRAELTPFTAPFGKQSLRTFFAKPLDEVRHSPVRIREALTAWRRVEGFTGEYLDHHVISSAADDPLGRTGTESGVPGATWLATMALPLLRVAGDGQHVTATLWHRAGRRTVMLWPLWRQPLDAPAVQALIEHPCLVPTDPTPAVHRANWPALGIFGVYGAERLRVPGQQYLRVLAPIPVAAAD